MDCVAKIQLRDDAPVKKILNIFKLNKSKERATFSKSEHLVFPLNNVLSIPYGMLGEDPQIVMDFIIFLIAERYGIYESHAISGQEFPCYYVNNTKTFLVPDPDKFVNYGVNLKDFSFLPLQEAIHLRNAKDEKISIGFVNSRELIQLNDDQVKSEIKDAWERADFILYDNIDDKK